MASLNLTPDLTIIGIQTGIFLGSCYTSKKLMLDPYLKVKKIRDARTVGSTEYAHKMFEQNEEKAEQISKTMNEALVSVNSIKSEKKEKAVGEKNKLIESAMGDASKAAEDIRAQIKKALEEERAKVPSIISQLTNEIYQLSIN